MPAHDLLQFDVPCITTLYDIDFNSQQPAVQLQSGQHPSLQPSAISFAVPGIAVPSSPPVQSLYSLAQEQIFQSLSSELPVPFKSSAPHLAAISGAALQPMQPGKSNPGINVLHLHRSFRVKSHQVSRLSPVRCVPTARPWCFNFGHYRRQAWILCIHLSNASSHQALDLPAQHADGSVCVRPASWPTLSNSSAATAGDPPHVPNMT